MGEAAGAGDDGAGAAGASAAGAAGAGASAAGSAGLGASGATDSGIESAFQSTAATVEVSGEKELWMLYTACGYGDVRERHERWVKPGRLLRPIRRMM